MVVLDELTTGLDPRARRDTWKLIEEIRDGGVTVLLVTHFMEEAQRLCDRIAVIDRGKVVALDTPAGLIRRATGSTVVSFVPSRALTGPDLTRLTALPGVATVTPPDREGALTLHGTDETVTPFVALLAELGVTAQRLRITETSLDEAFLDLTGQDL